MQNPTVHHRNAALKFMKEHYRKVQTERPQSRPCSSRDSMVVVPDTTWEDVAMEEDVSLTEVTAKVGNSMINFPPECLKSQGTIGDTYTDNVIQDLHHLAQHPEHFSFESHDTFMSEES